MTREGYNYFRSQLLDSLMPYTEAVLLRKDGTDEAIARNAIRNYARLRKERTLLSEFLRECLYDLGRDGEEIRLILEGIKEESRE